MIKTLLNVLLLMAITNIFAQTTGDYRTKGTATFGSATNWEIWNGSDWVTATLPPYNSATASQATSGSSATTAITLSAANANIYVGEFVTGTNIAPGTTVSAISGTSLTLSTTPTASVSSNTSLSFAWSYAVSSVVLTQNSAVLPISNTNGLAVGQVVSGTNIPTGLTIQSIIANTSVTLSGNITAVTPGTQTITFYSLMITASPTSGSNTIVLGAANTYVAVGQMITGSHIPNGTTVLAVAGDNITLTLSAKATGTGATNMQFGTQSIPNLYINHNVSITSSVNTTIGNVYVNNAANSYPLGTGGTSPVTPINAVVSLGASSMNNAYSLYCKTINIASSASFITTPSTGNSANQLYLMGGDGGSCLVNNGTFNLVNGTNNSNTTFSTANLNQNASTVVSGNGTFAFNQITVAMGYSAANTVDMQSPFTMATATTSCTLILSYGTFKISSASTITPIGSSSSGFSSNSIAGVSNVVVSSVSGNTLTLSAPLTTLTVGMTATSTPSAAITNSGYYISAINSSTSITLSSYVGNQALTAGTYSFSTGPANGLTINNSSAVINAVGGTNTSNPADHGINYNLTLIAGTLNWGSNANPALVHTGGGGKVDLTGGNMNVYGGYDVSCNGGITTISGTAALNIPAGGAVNMTSGGPNGNPFYIFSFGYNTSFFMSGGSVNIASKSAGTKALADVYISNSTGVWNITGGTFNFSDAATISYSTYWSFTKLGWNVTIAKGGGSGTKLIAAPLGYLSSSTTNIGGTLTVGDDCTFDAGTTALSVPTISTSANSTIKTQNTSSTPLGSFTGPFSGTVNFNGGTQTIPAGTYSNLNIGGMKGTTSLSGVNTTNTKNYIDYGTNSISNTQTGATVTGTGISGTVVAVAPAITGVSATLASSTSVTCDISGVVVGMAVSGNGIQAGTTVTAILNALSIQISQAATLTGSSTLTFNSTIFLSANATATNSNLTISLGTTVTLASGTTNIGGSLTLDYTGSPATFTNTAANTYNFNNTTGGQTIPALPVNYNNLTMGNTSGTQSLGAAITVNNTLTLTAGGKFSLGANNLSLAAAGTISGASSTSYFITNGAGKLTKLISAATNPSKTFEVGDATAYSPVTIAFTGTISNSTGSIGVSTTPGDHAQVAVSGLNGAKSVNRYWTISNSVALTGLTSYSPTFSFVAGDVDAGATTANFIVRKSNTPVWTLLTVGSKTATSTQATGLSTFGDFIVGEEGPPVVIPTVGTYTYNGSPQGPNTAANTGTGSSYTFSYSGTGGTTYGPTATLPTNAGAYTTTVTVAANGSYSQSSSSATAFSIAKATPTLSVSGTQSFNYNGSPQGPSTLSYNGDGSTSLLYQSTDGGGYSAATIPTLAGTYQVVANSTSTTNYNSVTTSAYNFTISAIVPNAPTSPAASAGDGQVIIYVTAPAQTGGAPILDYTATSSPGGITGTGAANGILVTGLTNGVAYTFTVTARNSAGSGAASSATAVTTPSGTITVSSSQNISDILCSPTSNIVINNGATLTINQNTTISSVTVNAGAKLDLSTNTLTSADVVLKASKTDAPVVSVSTPMVISGSLVFKKTLDNSNWFFISLPSSSTVATIGKSIDLGAVNTNWWIKRYRGDTRATNGGASSNWQNVSNASLTANEGYIVGLADALVGDYELSFTLDKTLLTAVETSKDLSVGTYVSSINATNSGWNLVGLPYLRRFDSNGIGVNFITKFNGSSYDQYATTDAALYNMNPFEAFFVQASSSTLTFATGSRHLVRSMVSNNLSDRVQLNITTTTGTDKTNLIIDQTQSANYEVNQDLEKWVTTGTSQPQLYTLLNGTKFAYNALPIENVQNLPLCIYTKTAGTSSISVDASQAPGITQLFLTDNITGEITDLLNSSYSFVSNAGTNTTRFTVSASKDISTFKNDVAKTEEPKLVLVDNKLMIRDILEPVQIKVHNALGELVFSDKINTTSFELPLPKAGIYMVTILSAQGKWCSKVIVN